MLDADDALSDAAGQPATQRQRETAARRPARAPRLPAGARAAASSVTQNDEGAYVVEGEGVEKLVARYDLDNEDALPTWSGACAGSA